MKKILLLSLSLVMGLCAFAQQVAVKSLPAPVKATLEKKSLGTDVVKGTVNFDTRGSSKPVVLNNGVDYMEAEAIYTTYDLQSNSIVANRMYQTKDGSVAVVATMSRSEFDESFLDRGTGYNFSKRGKIYNFGGVSAIREEAKTAGGTEADMRTGWPTIAPYGAEGEILVNFSTGLNYWFRTKAGQGEWDGPHAIPNPENLDEIVKGKDNALAWPRIVTTGENNEVLHVFAAASGDSNVAQYYLRTSDLQNWDIQFAPVEMDNLHINIYAADDYAVSANGENIAVVYCAGFSSHVMCYESNDGGLTWNSRMVWESPIHGLDWATDENSLFSKLYGPTQASVAIGKDGVTHVALGVGLYDRKTLGNSHSLYYGMLSDGVAYWNDTITRWEGVPSPIRSSQDDSLKHALRLWWDDPENEGMIKMDPSNFCAWMPPHAENGWREFDYTKQYTGSDAGTAGDYLLSFGLTAYPSIAVDPAGNLAVAYSSPDLNRALWNNAYYMRSIFVNYKPADSAYWWQMSVAYKNLYDDFIHSGDEATFISAISTPVNENEFWFSCLSDDTPGFHTGTVTSQANITTSTVNVFKFDPTGELNDYDEYGGPGYNSIFVFASVSHENTGTVTGSGVYNYGEEVTLSATPNEGYRFLNWTENGEVVSTNAYYSFTVTQERNLVANFEEVDESEQPGDKEPQFVSKEQQNRNVLIEEFTGRVCQFCPDGHNYANRIVANNPGRVWAVNIHSGGYSPTSYPNLNTTVSSEMARGFYVDSYPSGVINRSSGSTLSRYVWETETDTQLAQTAEVNMGGQVVVNPVTRIATITVEAYYTGNSEETTNYLTIMMLQDSIFGSQSGSTSNPAQIVNGEYCHMHTLRDIVTDTWGDAIAPTIAGSLITKTYTYEIPEVIGDPNGVEVDLDNIQFLAFITEKENGAATEPILNVCELDKIEGTDEPIYPFIKSVEQEDMITCDKEKKFTVNVVNVGTEVLTSIKFEISVNNGETTTQEWTGRIPVYENVNIDLFADVPFGGELVTVKIVEANGEEFSFEKSVMAQSEEWIQVELGDTQATEQFKLELAQDRFGNQTKWQVVGHNDKVIASGGPYKLLPQSGIEVHEEYFTIPVGECVRFIIEDNVGNGITSENFGEGYYKIYDSKGDLLIESDGDFGFGEYHIIYVNGEGGDEPADPENPGGDEPNDPENPGGDEPEDPENPGGDEPEDPENPGGDEPEEPENPGDDEETTFTITAVANPEEGGTITGAGVYEENENVTLTATANECYQFVNWTEDGEEVSTNVKYSFKVTEDRELVANFELKTYDVVISVNPENAGTVTGAGKYLGNQEVTLTATPISGYRFVNWLEDGVVLSTETEYTFTVTKDRAIIANFVAIGSNLLTVTINPKEAGEVEGAGAYTENSTVTLKATAEASYRFVSWTENDVIVSTEKEYTFVLTSDRNLVANFAVIKYDVTVVVDPEEAGEVEGAGTYQKNTTVTLTAKANEGYKFVSWTEDDEVVSTDEEYSFVIKRDRELTANFVSTEGIEENASAFNIYPNPVDDKLYIETLTQTQTLTVEIYDIYGRQQSMVNGQQSTVNGQQPTVIDVTNLNSGVYFVKVVTKEGETVKRFIKK